MSKLPQPLSKYGQFASDSLGFEYRRDNGEILYKWEVFAMGHHDANQIIRDKVRGVKAYPKN